MKDENGVVLSENEILKTALDHIAEACCFLFELESDRGQAVAWMADSLLKYGNVVYNDDCPIMASCDYQKYEERKYQEKVKKLKTVK